MNICQTPQGPILCVASGNTVQFYDAKSFNLLQSHTMPIHFHEEGGVSLHPSGNRFIAGGSDTWVRVFDRFSGAEIECHKGHHGPVRCLRYAPDGQTFATGSEDGTIRIWEDQPQP
jgi:serine-threonine kinase receptor-associated protein